ncbi:fimbrial biogenesis chaperone [Pseudomonas agarici]|uniref:fimbrial biogenesis chaperone n=1 Tax=Pseudomonas agarici TaxID=46677 RepID=UPI0015A11067|nr:molecular chaperone [Pseudomonas agarici]
MPTTGRVTLFWGLTLAGLCSLCAQAHAQALEIVPISQQLAPGQRAASFTLTNRADSESIIQIRSFGWSQNAQGDALHPIDQLIVSPPFARIAPGQSQIVRIMLRQHVGETERAYRILFDQLPGKISGGKIEMTLRLTVPVFANVVETAKPDLRWRIELLAGIPTLIAVNHGLQHGKLLGLELSSANGQHLKLLNQGLPYVLAGVERHWSIADTLHQLSVGARVRLRTSGPGRPHEQWLVVGGTM